MSRNARSLSANTTALTAVHKHTHETISDSAISPNLLSSNKSLNMVFGRVQWVGSPAPTISNINGIALKIMMLHTFVLIQRIWKL